MDLDGVFENTVEFFARMPKRWAELDDATRADARNQGARSNSQAAASP
jgi:hypothetical protein